MSATAQGSPAQAATAEIHLNDQQVDAIIDYALKAGMYDGEPPAEKESRRSDAATLIYQARRARDNGNTSTPVQELCFIADVDQNASAVPDPPAPQQPAEQPPALDPAAAFAPQATQAQQPAPPPPPAAPAQAAEPASGDNPYANYDIDQLQSIIDGLTAQSGMPAVAAEIERCKAEIARKQSAQAQAPQEVPPAAPPAPAAPQSPALPDQQSPAAVPPPPPGQQLSQGDTDAAGQVRPRLDAGFDAGQQAPQPADQGSPAQPKPPSEVEQRAALRSKITYGTLEAYGKTFDDLSSMPIGDLERMLAYPGGPEAPQAPPPPQISAERARLEEQVTGPMLKAWGRGRVQIPQLSDEDLAEMVSYPAGPTTRPQGQSFTENQPAPPPAPPETAAVPPAFALAQAEASPSPAPPAPQAPQQPPQPTSAGVPIVPPSRQVQGGAERAMAVIAREQLPIPPDISEPPQLPEDISKIDDVALRSVSGRFHAVESRVNWLISEHEDEIFDRERAKNIRSAEIRNTPREGKAPTKDQMQAIVDADPEVQRIEGEIHEVRTVIHKLKVIRDNAHLTCQRVSREFAMRWSEERPEERGTR